MRWLVAGAAFSLGLFGCSLIVSFDDMPPKDAGIGLPDSRPQTDVGVVDTGAGEDSGVIEEDATVTTDAGIDYTSACTGRSDGKYCNGNQLFVDGGSKDDLVSCVGGVTANVVFCTNGCQRMPSGYPDECDPCKGKATGLYCGDDFVGWHPKNKNTRIRCDNNAIVGNLICSTACIGTGPTASCQ